MDKQHILVGVLIEESTTISFVEVCQKYHISQELLIDMIEHGLFPQQTVPIETMQLQPKDLRRIESAFRLHQDLGINLPGVAVALDLLEQIEEMRRELDILRKHMADQ